MLAAAKGLREADPGTNTGDCRRRCRGCKRRATQLLKIDYLPATGLRRSAGDGSIRPPSGSWPSGCFRSWQAARSILRVPEIPRGRTSPTLASLQEGDFRFRRFDFSTIKSLTDDDLQRLAGLQLGTLDLAVDKHHRRRITQSRRHGPLSRRLVGFGQTKITTAGLAELGPRAWAWLFSTSPMVRWMTLAFAPASAGSRGRTYFVHPQARYYRRRAGPAQRPCTAGVDDWRPTCHRCNLAETLAIADARTRGSAVCRDYVTEGGPGKLSVVCRTSRSSTSARGRGSIAPPSNDSPWSLTRRARSRFCRLFRRRLRPDWAAASPPAVSACAQPPSRRTIRRSLSRRDRGMGRLGLDAKVTIVPQGGNSLVGFENQRAAGGAVSMVDRIDLGKSRGVDDAGLANVAHLSGLPAGLWIASRADVTDDGLEVTAVHLVSLKQLSSTSIGIGDRGSVPSWRYADEPRLPRCWSKQNHRRWPGISCASE